MMSVRLKAFPSFHFHSAFQGRHQHTLGRIALKSFGVSAVGLSSGFCRVRDSRKHLWRHIVTPRKEQHVHFSTGFCPTTPRLSPTFDPPTRSNVLSPRQWATLEDYLLTHIRHHVNDPILEVRLGNLGWLKSMRQPRGDDGRIVVEVRIPTKLYPRMELLEKAIREGLQAAVSSSSSPSEKDETIQKLCQQANLRLENVTVEISSAKPIPTISSADAAAVLSRDEGGSEQEKMADDETLDKLGPGLKHVSQYLAVYSCKGGVGKSTIAVNLAYELAHRGVSVGLVDVDVYGPSLSVLVKPTDVAVRKSPLGQNMVYPIQHQGVKLMSLGYVSSNSGVPGSGADGGAAVMRGPMAGRVITQLIKGTDWGDLDVLIIDLPPGTGDVQLSLCQELQVSAALAVTTPSKVALADVRRGIELFTNLNVPTIGVVENMSYFECEGGSIHHPFGKGLTDDDLMTLLPAKNGTSTGKTDLIVRMPISERTNHYNDDGIPLCLERPANCQKELEGFQQVANAVSTDLLRLRYEELLLWEGLSDAQIDPNETFSVGSSTFETSSMRLTANSDRKELVVRFFGPQGATQFSLLDWDLRFRDPKTGERQAEWEAKSKDSKSSGGVLVEKFRASSTKDLPLFPVEIQKKGKYGFEVSWADGATIIYSFPSIVRAIREQM